jgi:hypothetical protein
MNIIFTFWQCWKNVTPFSVNSFRSIYTCNMESDERKSEAQVLRVCVRKASGDISKRPSALIRSALQTSTENNLLQLDVTNASKAIYRERRNIFPALPKSKDDVHDAVEILDTKTNKSENFVISNDRGSGTEIARAALKCSIYKQFIHYSAHTCTL